MVNSLTKLKLVFIWTPPTKRMNRCMCSLTSDKCFQTENAKHGNSVCKKYRVRVWGIFFFFLARDKSGLKWRW